MTTSLQFYQGSEFYYINKYLREGISDEEFMINHKINQNKLLETKQHITNIDNDFLHNPMKSDGNIIVYRGDHGTSFGNPIYQGLDKGFVSTSTSIRIAQKYAWKTGVIYEMRLKKDVPYIDLSVYFAYEEELLLNRGLTFTIVSQKKLKKNTYIVMDVTNT